MTDDIGYTSASPSSPQHIPAHPENPDPTLMTTVQLDRSLAALHQYVDGQLSVRDERLTGIDRATLLRLQSLNDVPRQVDEKVRHLRELLSERFSSVAQQFVERDVRSDQQARASADALAAALQAAKELVGAQGEASAAAAVKSETSFTKQIDQIGTIIQTLEKALDARITELKERIDRGEGATTGGHDTRVDQRASNTVMIGAVGLIVTIIVAALAIYAAVKP